AFPGNAEMAEGLHSWSSVTQEEDFPSPPAWLDVLTKFDWQQGDLTSTTSTRSQEFEVPNENVTPHQTHAEPEFPSPKPWDGESNARSEAPVEEEQAFFFTTEESDSELEWPEWLKSLGAETLETHSESEPAVAIVDLEQGHSSELQSWAEQLDQTFSEAEQEQMATLEHLDNDLLSQGFVPLQPGTLNSIAEETSLSSALAELGNFPASPSTPELPSIEITTDSILQPPEASEAPPTIQADNLEAGEAVTTKENILHQNAELSQVSTTQQSVAESNSAPLETPLQQPVIEEAGNQTFIPVENTSEKVVQEIPLIPTYRADAFLEDDLETTMKRPAIRLQSMQHSASHPDTLSMLAKGHVGEHVRAHNDNPSNKERLLRGYQLQLAGAYDDAMAEYRIIIRNAPDLLSEVISNVRALLKLSPRYSIGFRVLGDAYMRQGEYLQAMEAYNRALTIAKKAKSQSV
ncbi:MAG TPA: tetratricopeptide repeat protein, partial [Ktedonobacteraceae bacterium]|nr:tetratricopeptide repeat protein [Ktedonobacteraceae bacterium]